MGRPINLSVCMIVRNEAHQLEAALRNFKLFADEIVVVDTGSTDATRAIAEKYADVVADYSWHDDFAAARNASLARARGRYLLWLDADDRVDDENVEKIRRLKTLWDGRAYCFVVKDIQYDKPFRTWLQIRCVPNVPGIKFKRPVHETLYDALEELGIEIIDTDIVIEHHGYANPYTLKFKVNRNIDILKKAEANYPEVSEDISIQYYLAHSYHTIGDYDRSLLHMSNVIRSLRKIKFSGLETQKNSLDHFLLDAILFCAETYLERGRPNEAQKYLMQLAVFSSLHPYVLFRMGKLAQRLNRHQEALEYFRRVDLTRQTVTRLPWPLIDLPVLLSHQAFSLFYVDGPEACSRWVLSLENEMHHQVWENLGILAVESEQWDLAFLAFHRDWNGYRLSSLGWSRYGSLRKQLGRLDLAVKSFQKALVEDPNNIEATIKLANTYWQMGADRRAFKLFETLVTKGVDDPPVVKAYQILRERSGLGI